MLIDLDGGKMVTAGIVIMFFGYLLLSIPTAFGSLNTGMILMFGALAMISIGTGFFKGNLQVMVGNLYDDPKYKAKEITDSVSFTWLLTLVHFLFQPLQQQLRIIF